MMRHKFTIGAVALAFAVSAAPAIAQENPRSGGGGSRSSGGERTGSAVPRGSGGSGGSGGGESSGGGMSGGSMGSSSSPSTPSSSRVGSSPAERYVSPAAERAPRRSDDQASGRRRSGGEGSGERAVTRGGSAAGGGSTTRTAGSTDSTRSVDRSASPSRRAVPVASRPRGDRPVTGVATSRGTVVRPPNDLIYIYRPYYNPWGFYGSSLGYGLGYLYYDPFWYGSGYDGYGYGYGSGYYGGGYGSGYYGSGGYSQTYRDSGSLRLKLKPREAQVFVDGYFVGVVDSFDGVFQKLQLDGGGHQVEVKAEGYEPLQFDVLITPGETVTYKGEMKSVK